VSALGEAPAVLTLALGADEVLWLKQAWAAALKAAPAPHWPGGASVLGLAPGAWPDLGEVTARSPFRSLGLPSAEALAGAYLACDQAWFEALGRAADDEDDPDLVRFVAWERQAAAAVTALRWRVTFGWDLPRARAAFGAAGSDGALGAFSRPLDRREDWDSWPLASCLNPRTSAGWVPDPAAFEQAVEEALLGRARGLFRGRPATVAGLYGYVRWRWAEGRRRIRALETPGREVP
jgi:hypothetical protein